MLSRRGLLAVLSAAVAVKPVSASAPVAANRWLSGLTVRMSSDYAVAWRRVAP